MLRMNGKLRLRVVKLVFLLALLAVLWRLGVSRVFYDLTSFRASFSGPTSRLARTEVVGLLDEPILPGESAVWCASLQSAWKSLENDLAHEPVQLDGEPERADALNNAWNPEPDMPAGSSYTAVGWVNNGILTKIHRDLAGRFRGEMPPDFPGIARNSFVAYSRLNARMRFSIPYFQNRKPLEFTDSAGRKTKINSFGIRPQDDYAYDNLRKQANGYGISSSHRRFSFAYDEFAVDLCADSSPSQIVVARISRPKTVAEGIARVEKAISKSRGGESLGPTDVLLVPDMAWQISHRFKDLEGRRMLNRRLSGQSLDVAQEDIAFRLDRSGAEVMSQSKLYCCPLARWYVFDRPFLVYMKKRGSAHPYFAMWVDNAELLRRW